MVSDDRPKVHDKVSWTVLSVLAAACLIACGGLGFEIGVASAVPAGAGVAILVAVALFARAHDRPRLFAGAVAFLQMTAFTLLAVILSYALAARGGPLWDDRLAAADAALHLDWAWLFRVADGWPLMLWIGGIAYYSLVAQMIVCILALSAYGQLDRLRLTVAAAVLSGGVTIAISGVMPAIGNLFDPAAFRHLWPSVAWQERALVTGLRSGAVRVLDLSHLSGIVSFPSYHATLTVILAWSQRDVPALKIAAPVVAALTVLATPLFGGHYGVDVLAGLGLALLAVAVAPRLMAIRRWPSPMLTPGGFVLAYTAPVEEKRRP